jgi:hypothetical protein
MWRISLQGFATNLLEQLLALRRLLAPALRQHHSEQVGLLCSECPPDDRCICARRARCVHVIVLSTCSSINAISCVRHQLRTFS